MEVIKKLFSICVLSALLLFSNNIYGIKKTTKVRTVKTSDKKSKPKPKYKSLKKIHSLRPSDKTNLIIRSEASSSESKKECLKRVVESLTYQINRDKKVTQKAIQDFLQFLTLEKVKNVETLKNTLDEFLKNIEQIPSTKNKRTNLGKLYSQIKDLSESLTTQDQEEKADVVINIIETEKIEEPSFFSKHKKKIIIGTVVVVAIVVGGILISKFVLPYFVTPQIIDAASSSYSQPEEIPSFSIPEEEPFIPTHGDSAIEEVAQTVGSMTRNFKDGLQTTADKTGKFISWFKRTKQAAIDSVTGWRK